MNRIDVIGQNGNDGLHYDFWEHQCPNLPNATKVFGKGFAKCDVCGAKNPNYNSDPIVEAVRAKLLARSQVGLSKYGVGLDRQDLSRLDWLRHAQEEALDLAGYLEVLIQNEIHPSSSSR